MISIISPSASTRKKSSLELLMGKELTTPITYTIDSNTATPRYKKSAPSTGRFSSGASHLVHAVDRTLLVSGSLWANHLTLLNLFQLLEQPRPKFQGGGTGLRGSQRKRLGGVQHINGLSPLDCFSFALRNRTTSAQPRRFQCLQCLLKALSRCSGVHTFFQQPRCSWNWHDRMYVIRH